MLLYPLSAWPLQLDSMEGDKDTALCEVNAESQVLFPNQMPPLLSVSPPLSSLLSPISYLLSARQGQRPNRKKQRWLPVPGAESGPVFS